MRRLLRLAAIFLAVPTIALPTIALPAIALAGDPHSTRTTSPAISNAQHDLSIVMTNLRRDFEQSSDLISARSMRRSAIAYYEETCDSALAPLRATTKYKQLSEQIMQLETRRRWGTFDDHMTPAQLADVARSLLDARQHRTVMESSVLSGDSEIAKARFAMIDANGKLLSIIREFNESILSNPQFAAARDRLMALRDQSIQQARHH